MGTACAILSCLLFSSIFYITTTAADEAATKRKPFAQGNMFVVFNANSAKSDDEHPLKAIVPDLWCIAVVTDKHPLPIQKAQFIRYADGKRLEATLTDDSTRARLVFNTATVAAAGKYKCIIDTTENETAWGILEVRMRPVFHSNVSRDYAIVDDNRFHIKASAVKVTEGESVVLSCPAVGYPEPTVRWFKDNSSDAIEKKESYTVVGNDLHIDKVDSSDHGVYTCIATNQFTVRNGTEEQMFDFESRLDQILRVRGSYRWIYPLILIVIMLLLLFIIIYGCAAFNRYKTYNVEKRERRRARNYAADGENEVQQQPILGLGKQDTDE